MNSELLISMFVSGKYKYYVPMFELFLDAAYPEYDFIIDHVICSDDAKFLRWRKLYFNYAIFKYIYIGDIDILIMRDTPTLLEKHLAICEKQGLPFSNTCGIDDPATRGRRVTGLHFFINNGSYLDKMRGAALRLNYTGISYNEKLKRLDNQKYLYNLLRAAGYEIPNHKEFYYDGLHLGHSRVPGRWDALLKTPQPDANYPEFWRQFKDVEKSQAYKDIYAELPPFIKTEIDTMTAAMRRAYE